MRKPTAIAAIVLILAACAALLYGQEPTLEELQQRLEAAETYRDGVRAELDTAKATVTTLEGQLVDAEAAVVAAQEAVDNYVPPKPVPAVYPLTVNCKKWTFRTPPPANLTIRQHPRFIIPGREAELKRKLTDEDHTRQRQLAIIRQPEAYDALLYAINHDEAAGQRAKSYLLSLEATGQGNAKMDTVLFGLWIYDWCHDLFDDIEREQAMRILLSRLWLTMPEPGSTEFSVVRPEFHGQKNDGFTDWFGNDSHDPTQSHGFLFRGLVALAFHGDGVRDAWCEHVYQVMLHNTDGRIYPVYDELRGGLLDSHNQRALDSGGIQSGLNYDRVMGGYEQYFSSWLPVFMESWCTATGDDLWTDNNYFRLMPYRVAYNWHKGLHIAAGQMRQVLLMQTGLYRERDPEMAGLARWLADADNFGSYKEFEVLLLGDLSVQPIHPAQIPRMRLSKYLNGDDRVHSRSSWEPDATCVQMFTQAMNTHRYEGVVGGLYIARNGKPLVMRGQGRKSGVNDIFVANMRIWDKNFSIGIDDQGMTFWGGAHLRGPFALKPWVDRVAFPFDAASIQSYWGPQPTEDQGTADYHVFAVDSAAVRIVKTTEDDNAGLQRGDIRKSKRTLVHLRPNTEGREFVIVHDRIDVADNLTHCWQARFLELPTVNGNQWTALNGGQQITGTVLSPAANIEIAGGPGTMTEQPDGTITDDKLFQPDGGNAHIFGMYAVYVKPQTVGARQNYCVVLEVGDAGFAPAAATISGDVVSVGGWSVDFSQEDETKVTK